MFPVSPRTDKLSSYRDRWDKLELMRVADC